MPGSNILPFNGISPTLGRNVFLATGSHVIGDLVIGDDSNIWFNVTIRADVNTIRIGARTNIQDNSVVHVTSKTGPTSIGSDVTIGHGAIIHACTISDLCLIGMGSVILDGAKINRYCLVAAGSVVTPGKEFPEGMLIKGSPAIAARPLTEAERAYMHQSALDYMATAAKYFT